ncbi:electron transporter RnfE [Ruminococcaceae bacterium OttesenSCG-928-A16]|nr:electron transporter RnfE [Ruminococcaceae bacterium OttesenSCG-928-A16]
MKDGRIRYLAENMDRLSRRDRVFLNNPVIMQGLGLAPIIIPATNIQNATIIAVAVILLLTPTRMVATFISRHVGDGFRALIYVLTACTLYAGVSYVMDQYLFGTAMQAVGIYLPLLVIEPLIIKRYGSAQRERISTSFKKGFVTTLGFCLVLFLMAGLRELLATGAIGGIIFFKKGFLPMAEMPAGGFILLGLVAALWRAGVNTFKKRISLGVKKLQ